MAHSRRQFRLYQEQFGGRLQAERASAAVSAWSVDCVADWVDRILHRAMYVPAVIDRAVCDAVLHKTPYGFPCNIHTPRYVP